MLQNISLMLDLLAAAVTVAYLGKLLLEALLGQEEQSS